LSAELPITLYRSNTNDSADNSFKLVLETEALETYPNYPGHEITVLIYEPDPNNPYHSVERVLANGRFTKDDNNRKEVEVRPGAARIRFPLAFGCALTQRLIRASTMILSGPRLSLISANYEYYASIGFKIPKPFSIFMNYGIRKQV
jgi:hypothetical protein